MGFDKPIQRFDDDKSKEWSLPPVERLERDKKRERELSPSERSERTNRALMCAALAINIQHFLETLSSKEKFATTQVDFSRILKDLRSFKMLLEQLGREDVSHTPHFGRQFSDLWHSLSQDLQRIEAFEGEKPQIGPKLKRTLETIGSFPPTSDHPLGYYLIKHVGEEWLPFPFMDILSLLHREYQQNKQRSVLSSWLTQIQDTLTSIEIRPDLI